MPDRHVCCGRPLYDYGFLDSAGRYLRRVLDVLRPYVREDIPVVGMEPSCLAVFKDELRRMLPHDDDASRLTRNAYHFGEFCTAFGIKPPRLHGRAILWGHCHQRATGGVEPDEQLLQQMGLEVRNLKGGCCGLAGSWGFEAGKHGISMDCGEQALLPAIRQAEPDTLVVADGFSCQTQIADAGTGRRALHTAQVMAMAREPGRVTAHDLVAAAGQDRRPRPGIPRRLARTGLPALTAAAGLAGLAALAGSRAAARRH